MAEDAVRAEVRREVRSEAKQQASGFQWRNHVYTEYFRTKEGILKLIELVFVLLALILASAAAGGKTDASAIEFFVFVTTAGFVSSLCHIFLILIGIYFKLPNIVLSNIVQLAIYGVAVVVFLISSIALVAKWGHHGTLATAAVFGFVCTGLFFVELAIWFARFRSSGAFAKPSDGQQAQTAKTPDDFADPGQPGY